MSTNPITRRAFLAGTGATVASLLAARAASADPTPKIILGEGHHRYECLHDWLTPPDNIKWGDTQGIAEDSQGRIYITHTVNGASEKKDAVVVFDKNGKFLTSWGERFAGGGHGIDARKEGKEEFLYHCDTAHRVVVKTTLDGKVIWEKTAPPEPGVYKDGAPFVPTNVCFSPNGDFYIADGYGSNWIHQYDSKANWIRTFGGPGKDPGKFQTCHGLRVDTRLKEPLLVVTDRAAARSQYLTLDGKPVSMITDGMRLPCHFFLHGDEMAVADLKSVVNILDKNNKIITQLGDGASLPELRDHPRVDFVPGKFIHPHDVRYLRNGNILVAEWIPIGRVTLLRRVKA